MKKSKQLVIIAALLAGLMVMGAGSLSAQFKLPDDVGDALDFAKDAHEAAKPWTYPEERATGRVLAAKVAKHFGGVWKHERWNLYVNLMGRSLVPYSKRPDIKYRFAILNTDDVNAYSCPGGYIFVTRGLLKLAENEAQLAGVLAHEIAHVANRHIEKEVKKQKLGAAVLDHGLDFATEEGEISHQEAEILKSVSDAGWKVLIRKGYTKQDEFEADHDATKNVYKLGYNPYALRGMLNQLQKGKAKKKKLEILLSTHPASDKRIDKIEHYIDKKGWKKQKDLKDRYRRMKKEFPLP
ncbi:MAG: M48 family metalloprotease [bacterium]